MSSDEEEPERRIYPSETAALAGGKALLKANELDDAADAFGQALELAIATHGEDSTATADYYMAYGDVLLRIVDNSSDVFGAGAQPAEDPRADQENTGAWPSLPACPGAPQRLTHAAALAEPGAAADAGAEAAAPSDAAAAPAEAEGAADADDLELAFQMLELARLRYEAMPTSAERCRKLADVYSRLGDLSQTNDQFDSALQEYQQALELRQEELDLGGTDVFQAKRAIAAEHANIACTLQYQDTPRLADALSHQQAALSTIDALMTSSTTEAPAQDVAAAQAPGDSSLADELTAIRADIHDKVEALREAVSQGLAPRPGAAAAALSARAPAATGESAGTTTIGFGAKPAQQSIGFGAPSLQASSNAPTVLAVKKKRKVAATPMAAAGNGVENVMGPAAAGSTTAIGFGGTNQLLQSKSLPTCGAGKGDALGIKRTAEALE